MRAVSRTHKSTIRIRTRTVFRIEHPARRARRTTWTINRTWARRSVSRRPRRRPI